jgi:hypothetical protein
LNENGQTLALLSELEKAGAISVTGLLLSRPDLPFDQFEALCVLLGRMHEAVRFAIGDAILLGEKLYREQAYQAIEQIGLSEKGRLEYVRVAEKVPRSVRRPDVSWSHHRAVATLPPNEQKLWLERAADEQLSHHDLREALRDNAPPAHPATCRCCGRALED